MKLPFGYKLKRVKYTTLEKDGKTVKIPMLDEIPEKTLKKILKKAGISEEEFIEAYQKGDINVKK